MNVANKLTILRIILTLAIIILLLFPFYTINVDFKTFLVDGKILVDSKYIIAGIIFVIAALTDFVDGYIARKYNMVTDFGKLMDAIADKVLVNSVLIILASSNHISPIVAVVVIMRDTIVNSIKMLAASQGKVVAAIKSGKLKTVCMMIGISLTFFYNLPFELWNIQVADFLLITATVLSIISAVQYYVMNRDLITKKGEVVETL
ncbi:MAG: CDP-diacylglycerol--glycerol-3-phosphate 3-phosphatidyltransferase [Bacilli bacterium]|nr:CDP-diacylglycerol--glycerol-3-phosphate 3-phosphatidyltransferase [Bacilli bacterium]MDD3305081.1 CDP-diacylglycerol--glycerol-3-phosphate 3-phosphatidyltransferase [Bacilli bacterium]MDD4053445.1 CDP-diacylglycerol--glycerol-3-phosphate 3-phosphatidyltransferase [Bacilli bacterium]MDD4410908.1 CDP-diacylglycerol--glycerol-3-phosphate 3-phosphatidyltransferase [Bacilli bacterium]